MAWLMSFFLKLKLLLGYATDGGVTQICIESQYEAGQMKLGNGQNRGCYGWTFCPRRLSVVEGATVIIGPKSAYIRLAFEKSGGPENGKL